MSSKSRQEKLKELNARKAGKDMVIVTDGTPFIEALQDKVDQLKDALGVGIDVDAHDLILELKKIESFVPAIEELVEAVNSIDIPEIPEMPESIEIEGLKEIADRFHDEIRLLNQIKNLELPDITVQVESINKKNSEKVSKKMEGVAKDLSKIQEKADKNHQKVLDRIDKLVQKIVDSQAKGQQAGEYIPTRRVRAIGNKLIFDDDAYSGNSSSGGGGIIDDSSSMNDGRETVTPKFAIISESASGAQEIIAAVANKRIRVLSYVIISNGTLNVKWQSASNDISGLLYLVSNTGASSGYHPKGHFQTAKGEALNLNLSGNIAIGGHISYIEVS